MKKLGSAKAVLILSIIAVLVYIWNPMSVSKAAFQIGVAILGCCIMIGIILLADVISKKITKHRFRYRILKYRTVEEIFLNFLKENTYEVDWSKLQSGILDRDYAKRTGIRIISTETVERLTETYNSVIPPFNENIPVEIHLKIFDILLITAAIIGIKRGNIITHTMSKKLIDLTYKRLNEVRNSGYLTSHQREHVNTTFEMFKKDIQI